MSESPAPNPALNPKERLPDPEPFRDDQTPISDAAESAPVGTPLENAVPYPHPKDDAEADADESWFDGLT